MAFTKKQIDVMFTKGDGSAFSNGAITVTLQGLRVMANITKGGLDGGGDTLDMKVFGLTKSQMNDLSNVGMWQGRINRNSVTVFAGDTRPLPRVFEGMINLAWADFDAMPQVAMLVQSQAQLLSQTAAAPNQQFPDTVDVATVLTNLAKRADLTLENNGVSATISSPSYYTGSIVDQARAIARDAQIYLDFDQTNKVLAIWPKNGSRGGASVTISKTSGLIGEPGFAGYNMILRSLYDPRIRPGGQVQVQSDVVTAANGSWIVVPPLTHHLHSEVPHGHWFSVVNLSPLNLPGTPPPPAVSQ